jgi:hypothetical protein
VADAHIGRPSARLKADLAAEATTLAQSFFRHLAIGHFPLIEDAAGKVENN